MSSVETPMRIVPKFCVAQPQRLHDLVGAAVLAEDPPQLLEPDRDDQLVEPRRGRLLHADPIADRGARRCVPSGATMAASVTCGE